MAPSHQGQRSKKGVAITTGKVLRTTLRRKLSKSWIKSPETWYIETAWCFRIIFIILLLLLFFFHRRCYFSVSITTVLDFVDFSQSLRYVIGYNRLQFVINKYNLTQESLMIFQQPKTTIYGPLLKMRLKYNFVFLVTIKFWSR